MTRYSLIPASYVYLLRDGAVLLQLRQNTGYMDGYWAAGAAGQRSKLLLGGRCLLVVQQTSTT